MSVSTLMEGVVWSATRHPTVLSVRFWIANTTILLNVLALGGIVWLPRFRDKWKNYADWVDAARCLICLCLICILPILPWSFMGSFYAGAIAFLPLGLLSIGGKPWQPSEYFPRLFVTGMAATQFLQPYPVAGSHLNIAAAPLLLCAFFCFHDGADGLFRLVTRTRDWFGIAVSGESVVGGILVVFFAVVMLRSGALTQHFLTSSSSLRGSASLHLPAEMEERYEFLANGLGANCDVLFTLPGMGSLNFWSGVPTPNGLNMTGWTKAFKPEQELKVLQILRANPRACAAYNAELSILWGASPQELEKLPLARYILHEMPVVSRREGYEIHVAPQRNSPWIEPVARSTTARAND